MELSVHNIRGLPLHGPGLGAGVEVTACHAESHGQHPVIRDCPVKTVLLHNVGQASLVGEEQGQVGGEDGLLHHVQHLLVLLRVKTVEDAVGLLLEDADPHVEVVVLHGAGGVHLGQGRLNINHELVVVASVIQIMTDCSNPLSKTLAKY